MKKTFVLGVGAQKAGTTWMYDYLHGHPNADLGFMKEYHIFDALYVPECRNWLNTYVQTALNSLQKDPTLQDKNNYVFKLLDFYRAPTNYFDFFEHLARSSTSLHLTGDITPSYSALDSVNFAYIRSELIARGFQVRVLFLMRDPVERAISGVRMRLRTRGEPTTAAIENEWLRTHYASMAHQIRARYDRTITNLEKVFEPSEIKYCFYEEFFNRARIEELCLFLDIPLHEPDFTKQFNVSRTSHVIEESLRREVYEFYKPVYAFVEQRFGKRITTELWKQY